MHNETFTALTGWYCLYLLDYEESTNREQVVKAERCPGVLSTFPGTSKATRFQGGRLERVSERCFAIVHESEVDQYRHKPWKLLIHSVEIISEDDDGESIKPYAHVEYSVGIGDEGPDWFDISVDESMLPVTALQKIREARAWREDNEDTLESQSAS